MASNRFEKFKDKNPDKIEYMVNAEFVMKQLDNALDEHTHTKASITDFPTTMPPSDHTHAYSAIIGKPTFSLSDTTLTITI